MYPVPIPPTSNMTDALASTGGRTLVLVALGVVLVLAGLLLLRRRTVDLDPDARR